MHSHYYWFERESGSKRIVDLGSPSRRVCLLPCQNSKVTKLIALETEVLSSPKFRWASGNGSTVG